MTSLAPRESSVQASVVALLKSVGVHVYQCSAYRAGGAHIEAGVPDLICLLPRGLGMFWFEVKASPKSKQRDSQVLFQKRCEESGVRYYLGGLDEARAALQIAGILAE